MELREIITEEFIEQFQDSFAYATGFGVVFVDLEGNHIGEGSNFTPFCAAINSTKEGAEYCAKTNRRAIKEAIENNKPSIYICHAGLVNIEVPVRFNGECIGAFTAGQVLCSDINPYSKDDENAEIPWLETKEAEEYFSQIKILTRQQIESTATALENVTNYIVQSIMYSKLQESLISNQNKMIEYEKNKREMEAQLRLAESNVLNKQVTPHFIFNVLGSISRLISLEEFALAEKMLGSFSKMLRYSIRDINTNIPLEKELDYVNAYLKIQKMRFSDKFDFFINYEDNCKQVEVPSFSLQFLVENAVEHGLYPLNSGGVLSIKCFEEGTDYILVVEDNGVGMEADELDATIERMKERIRYDEMIGLNNTYNRFKLMYGENLHFEIQSKRNRGTKITIRLPRKKSFIII